MMVRTKVCCVAVLAGMAAVALFTAPATALTQKECSVKYQAAKAGGTLNGQKYNDFRKAQCGADATPAAAPAAAPAPAAAAPAAPAAPKATEAKPVAPAAAPAAASDAVFPKAVDPKYASESAGKGRMHTCLDQYNANKASNANGGLKWIAKGGGYYSECNKHLKGA